MDNYDMLTQTEIEKIADSVVQRLESRSFRIPEEEHYLQHQELSELLKLLNQGRDFIVKGFAGLFAIGALAIALMGAKSGHWGI